ncbi:MAG: hypothetical protein WBG62_15660, partial [Cyclobacteriaceae bacterium]
AARVSVADQMHARNAVGEMVYNMMAADPVGGAIMSGGRYLAGYASRSGAYGNMSLNSILNMLDSGLGGHYSSATGFTLFKDVPSALGQLHSSLSSSENISVSLDNIFLKGSALGEGISDAAMAAFIFSSNGETILEMTFEVKVTRDTNTSNYENLSSYLTALSTGAFLASSSITVNELSSMCQFNKAYKGSARTALNKKFLGYFKGIKSKSVLQEATKYKVAAGVGKALAKPLFAVGVAVTAYDIYENDFSASSIAWGVADTGVALAAIAVSGPAAPIVAAGAAIYFAGRFAYGLYEVFNEEE